MIDKHLAAWEGVDIAALDYLFIENVGNLVCPSSYDLGEKIRVALLSVTEGEDKPLKYPTLFNSADAAVITKIDIAEPCGFNRDLALKNINEIRPGIRIFETSAKTGAGMDDWLAYLGGSARLKRASSAISYEADRIELLNALSQYPGRHAAKFLHDSRLQRINEHCVQLICQLEKHLLIHQEPLGAIAYHKQIAPGSLEVHSDSGA